MTKNIYLPIPSFQQKDETQNALNKAEPWFYEFQFLNGASTKQNHGVIDAVHKTRAEMVFPMLDDIIGENWSKTTCLDIACNEGWFSSQIAARGAAKVTGVDIRKEHIEKANLIKELSGLKNLEFHQKNILKTSENEYGNYDITLLLGLLYHVDDPIGIIRSAHALTKRMCIIETQVARSVAQLECRTIAAPGVRFGPGVALVASNTTHVEPGRGVVLVPSLDALYAMLYSVGFQRIFLVIPTYSSYEQFKDYDRVVLFAMR